MARFLLLAGRDVIGSAQRVSRWVNAAAARSVLEPTRELAAQVEHAHVRFTTYVRL